MAQVVLERQPLTSDAVAHKVVQMSRDRKFDNVGKCWHDIHTKGKMRSGCLKYVLYQNPVLYIQLIYFYFISYERLPSDGQKSSRPGQVGICHLVGCEVKGCSIHITYCTQGKLLYMLLDTVQLCS